MLRAKTVNSEREGFRYKVDVLMEGRGWRTLGVTFPYASDAVDFAHRVIREGYAEVALPPVPPGLKTRTGEVSILCRVSEVRVIDQGEGR